MPDEDQRNESLPMALSEEEKERLAEILAEKLREEMSIERDRCGYSG